MLPLESLRRYLLSALIVLLVAVWLGGGVTVDATPADDWLQLLALPVLGVAAWVLCRSGLGGLQRAAVAVAAIIASVPSLQLLPLPIDGWGSVAVRQVLAGDLASAGVSDATHRWSLTPSATEASLWALLPAMAAFAAALALEGNQRRVLVKAVLMLVLGNILFAFFQAGLPRGSTLRLYQGFDAGFGGLLINTNHQATALIVGMVLAIGQAIHAWRRQQSGRGRPHAWLWYAAFAGMCLLLVPLSTSRAGVALVLPALAMALLFCGALSLRKFGQKKVAIALGAGLGIFALIGVHAALGWMEVDRAEELRHSMASTAVSIGNAQAPWGSGAGSFVPVFEQAAPSDLWLGTYVNHAHNEYVQWWLEAGWLGLLAMIAVATLLVMTGWRLVQAKGRDGHAILAGSCFIAICAVLAHSWADYPMRTTTLMATMAALAGLMFGALADTRRPARGRGQRIRHVASPEPFSANS